MPLEPAPTPTGVWGRTMWVVILGALATGAIAAWMQSGTPEAIRVVVGGTLVVFAPGYAASKAVFPRRSVKSAEGLALVLAISVTVVIFVTLILNLLPSGLSPTSWTIGIGTVVTVTGAIASHRNPRHWKIHSRRRSPRWYEMILFALAAALVIGSLAVSRVPLAPPPTVHGYTDLWLVPEADHIRVGVASFELRPTRYQLELAGTGAPTSTYSLALRPRETWSEAIPGRGGAVEARLWLILPSGARFLYRDVRLPSSRGNTT